MLMQQSSKQLTVIIIGVFFTLCVRVCVCLLQCTTIISTLKPIYRAAVLQATVYFILLVSECIRWLETPSVPPKMVRYEA